MNRNKTSEPNGIIRDAVSLRQFEKITEIMDGRYDSGEILEDLNKSIFIPKQAGGNECELHNTISLMSHITKN